VEDAREDEHRCNVHVKRNSNKMERKEINDRRQYRLEAQKGVCVVCTQRWGWWLWERSKLLVGWSQWRF